MDTLTSPLVFGRSGLLGWLYLARLIVALGIQAGALLHWLDADPQQTFLATLMFVVTVGVTLWSAVHTHLRAVEPGENFLYAHVIFDVLLVTGIVHITGGQASSFAPLYVLVIAEGAILLPFAGGVLVGALACTLYFADLFWFYQSSFTGVVLYQIVLFTGVALVTGLLGDRVRETGLALVTARSELRQLRMDTDEILSGINTGVMTVDAAGRLSYLNPAGATLLGMDAAQWMGAPVFDAVEEAAPGMGEVLSRTLEDGLPVVRHRIAATRNGRDIVLGVSTTLGQQEGRRPSVTALFQDISGPERVEALSRRAERLEAVAELSASLAHEIKNPLASIRSAVEQITKPQLEESDRRVLERLVINESDRLSRLLSQFLDFGGLRIGRREVLDVRELARDLVTLLGRHPESQDGVDVRLVMPDEPLPVFADRDLLHRALLNLVLNAVQFAGTGGRVTVELRERLGGGRRARAGVRLLVRDTGPGIAEEDLPRIFDPFYTRRPGGNGLGLAVVHRAVVAHGGTVVPRNLPDGGAEFAIDLPKVSDTSNPEEDGG